jgi:hypothetical protein
MAKNDDKVKYSYNPSQKEEDRLNESYDRFEDARDGRSHVDRHWEAYEKQWEGYFADDIEDEARDTTGEYRSNVWVPMTFWLTMSAMSEYIQQNPTIMLLPTSDEAKPFTEIRQEIVNYSMEIGDFIIQMYKAFLDGSIFGSAPIYEYYRCEKREIKDISSYTPETEKVVYEKREFEPFKDVYAESFSPYHFYPEPYCESMNTCNYAFRRFIFNKDEFHALYDKKFKNGKIVLPAQDHLAADPKWDWWDTTGLTYLEDNQIEVLWEWHKIKDEMNVMANGVLLTKPDMPIPFTHKEIPIAVINSTMRSHRLWGKGMSEILEKLQYERNVVRNIALDQMRLNVLKVFFINPEAGLTDDQLKLKPGLAIPVKGDPRQAVYPLEYSGIKSERYKEEEMMDEDAIRATGISPEITGIPEAKTLGQAEMMRESLLKRIRLQMVLAYEDGLTRLGRLRVSNIDQFYQNPIKVEKIIGEDGVEAFTREYRRIRLKNKALAINEETGDYYLQNTQDGKYYFFQTIPDLFKNAENERFYEYDVKVDPQSSIKMSKWLLQAEDDRFFELYRGDPDIDQRKLKEDHIRSRDKNPEELLIQEEQGMLPPGALPAGGGGVSPPSSGPVTRVAPSAGGAMGIPDILPDVGRPAL